MTPSTRPTSVSLPLPGMLLGRWMIALLALMLVLTSHVVVASAQGNELSSAQARTAQFVFVIDDSGSMSKNTSGGPPADPERLSVFAVRSLLSMLDGADEATVVRLNGPRDREGIKPIEPLSQNRTALLSSLSLSGKLASYDGKRTPCRTALSAVKEELNRAWRPNVAQVVLFLTDGECTGEPPRHSSFLKGIRSHEEALFKFYLMRFRGREYTRSLEELASETGGEPFEVSATDPTSILKPFASAISRSQGYEAYLLRPGKNRLEAHSGARRVRLLAVAPDRGSPLDFSIHPGRKGTPPKVLGAPRKGVHQYESGKRFRFAALDYEPGEIPITVDVKGAGSSWKVVAIPEYRLFVDMRVRQKTCAEEGPVTQFINVGESACIEVRLINEKGEPVSSSITGRTAEAIVRYNSPESVLPGELPATQSGERAVFVLERASMARGDHVFRPLVKLAVPGVEGARITLRGAARTLQVSSRQITAKPSRFELGELVPGDEKYNELTIEGNFPASRGRLVVEGRQDVPECVRFELSGVVEGESQSISANQKYTVATRIDPFCGPASFKRDVSTALRVEFDKAAHAMTVPSLVIPVHFHLVSKIGVPKSVKVTIRGGENEDVEVRLDGNFKRDMKFQALVPKSSERGTSWPEGKLDVVFSNKEGDVLMNKTTEKPALGTDVTFGVGGGSMKLRVLSDACCSGGTYNTELALIPKSGVKDVVRIPVEIQVEDAGIWRCWGPFILWALLTLFLLLMVAYVINMFRNSSFIRRDFLASRIVPLQWDEWGEPQPNTRQGDDVKRMIKRNMRLHLRILNWIKANPLRIGLPGESYDEAIQLYLEPARDVTRSRVVLVPERDLHQEVRKSPSRHRGRIFATAQGGIYFFAVPDREGRLGRLKYVDEYAGFDMGMEETDEPDVVRLRRHELLDINADPEPDMAAGWRVG